MELNTALSLLLLAQHPQKRRFIAPGTELNYGITGAVLLDMSFQGVFTIEGKRLVIKNKNKLSDPIQNVFLQKVLISKKDRRLAYWVAKLSRHANRNKWALMAILEKKKLVKIEQKHFLGIIPYKRSLLIEQKTRMQLIQEINKCVLSSKEHTQEELALLAMIEVCKLHKVIAKDKEQAKLIKKELKIIIKESPIAQTVESTIKEIQAAIIAATMAATIATTASAGR
jgi:golgi phosphoprotein 3